MIKYITLRATVLGAVAGLLVIGLFAGCPATCLSNNSGQSRFTGTQRAPSFAMSARCAMEVMWARLFSTSI
jgi:xanthine/uracil permease